MHPQGTYLGWTIRKITLWLFRYSSPKKFERCFQDGLDDVFHIFYRIPDGFQLFLSFGSLLIIIFYRWIMQIQPGIFGTDNHVIHAFFAEMSSCTSKSGLRDNILWMGKKSKSPVDRWFIRLFIGFQPSFWWCRISHPSTVFGRVFWWCSRRWRHLFSFGGHLQTFFGPLLQFFAVVLEAFWLWQIRSKRRNIAEISIRLRS